MLTGIIYLRSAHHRAKYIGPSVLNYFLPSRFYHYDTSLNESIVLFANWFQNIVISQILLRRGIYTGLAV